jgi:hypothetical protein
MKTLALITLCLICPALVGGQIARPIGVAPHQHAHAGGVAVQTTGRAVADEGGTPRWIKWGLVGAAGGAVLFGIAGQQGPDRHREWVSDAAYGAATGFVLIGGGVLFYDWVCSRGSRSRAAGLCGR